jgi:hypothetical protein
MSAAKMILGVALLRLWSFSRLPFREANESAPFRSGEHLISDSLAYPSSFRFRHEIPGGQWVKSGELALRKSSAWDFVLTPTCPRKNNPKMLEYVAI